MNPLDRLSHPLATTTADDDLYIEELNSYLDNRSILHFGSLAGYPYTLAVAMRDLGIKSENVIHSYRDVSNLDRRLSYDQHLYNKDSHPHKKLAKNLSFLANLPNKYGLVHYHSSNIFPRELHWLAEGPFLSLNKVPMVLSLGGGDARIVHQAKRRNKFFYRSNNYLRDTVMLGRWWSWSKYINLIASDVEMLTYSNDFIKRKHTFYQPIDLKRLYFRQEDLKDVSSKPIILHVPTEPKVKGSDIIAQAISRLKASGFEFEYVYGHNLAQADFYKLLNTCTIYIDELRCGSYGVTASEALAMGKVVVTYIADAYKSLYPSTLPIISANPDTLESVLSDLLNSPAMLPILSRQSRYYAKQYHDSRVVSLALVRQYVNLFRKIN